MEIVNMNQVKKMIVGKDHGEALFQRILGRGTDKPDLMKSIKGLSKITIPPGGSNKIHVHDNEEQIYIVIRGRGVVQVGDEEADAGPGDVIYLPAKKPHGFNNTSNQTCVLLNMGAST